MTFEWRVGLRKGRGRRERRVGIGGWGGTRDKGRVKGREWKEILVRGMCGKDGAYLQSCLPPLLPNVYLWVEGREGSRIDRRRKGKSRKW